MKCRWWQRLWHRRLRLADITMCGTIVGSASTAQQAQAAWDIFTHARGQEHWLCECGEELRMTLRKCLWAAAADGDFEEEGE